MTKSYCDAYNAGFEKGYARAKNEMERQVLVTSDGKIHPLDAQPHWIPCSVRMPEDGRRVLFQMTNCYIDVLRFNATGITTHLVAWMPLPEPYGGESE